MRSATRITALVVLAVLAPTLPAAGQVRFLVAADNRDYAGFAAIMEQAKGVEGGPPEFIVMPGDVDPAHTTRAVLDRVFTAAFPWYVAVGNHDVAREEEMSFLRKQFGERLAGKVNPGPVGARETVYSFDAGSVHIVMINEFWNGEPGGGSDSRADGDVVPALRTWLDADLAATGKPFKIVFGHEPAFPMPDQDLHDSRHAESSLNKHPSNRDAFWKVLEARGVSVYLCGHTHRYSKLRPEGSPVWQLDVGEARGETKGWIYDTFVLATADARSLRFQVYRNFKQRGRFEPTDSLAIAAPAVTPNKQEQGSLRPVSRPSVRMP